MTFSDVSSLKMGATKGRPGRRGLRHVGYAVLGAVLTGAAITPFLMLAIAVSQGIVVV